MLAQEGGRSFFKGLAGPLYSVAFQNAAVFTAYEAAVRVVQSLRSEGSDATGAARDPPPTLGEAYVAGLMAGIAQTALVTPIDLVKIQRQLMAPGGGGAEEARASGECRVGALRVLRELTDARMLADPSSDPLSCGELTRGCAPLPATALRFAARPGSHSPQPSCAPSSPGRASPGSSAARS